MAALTTFTADVSLTGALLSRRTLGQGPSWEIELFLPGDRIPLCCVAVLARSTETHLGVEFHGMSEADRGRLAAALLEHQRRTAARQGDESDQRTDHPGE